MLDTTPDAPTPLQLEIAAVVVATILLISDIYGVTDVVTVLRGSSEIVFTTAHSRLSTHAEDAHLPDAKHTVSNA